MTSTKVSPEVIEYCKEKVPNAHLDYALIYAIYPEIYEALKAEIPIFDYWRARRFISHEKLMSAAKEKIDISKLSLAHDCYYGPITHTDRTLQRKLWETSGDKHHDIIMSAHRSGVDDVYEYAIFDKSTTAAEKEEFLKVSNDIKWYPQLKFIGKTHNAIMELAKSGHSLESVWKAHNDRMAAYYRESDDVKPVVSVNIRTSRMRYMDSRNDRYDIRRTANTKPKSFMSWLKNVFGLIQVIAFLSVPVGCTYWIAKDDERMYKEFMSSCEQKKAETQASNNCGADFRKAYRETFGRNP